MLTVKIAVLGFLLQLVARSLSSILPYYQPILAIAAAGSMA
jgi:hypothetical protein